MPWPKTPSGEVTVDTPDGVTKTFGNETRNSLYDGGHVYDGRSYGAFPQTNALGFCERFEPPRRSNGDVKPTGDE